MKKQKNKKPKSRLNIFALFKVSFKPRFWLKNIRCFFRVIKFAYQRVTRGFCDADWWNMDLYIFTLMHDILIDFADHTNGYPDSKYESMEKWQNELYRVAECFRKGYEDGFMAESEEIVDFLTNGKEKSIKDILNAESKLLDYDKINEEIKDKNIKEAFDWLKNNYEDLWD